MREDRLDPCWYEVGIILSADFKKLGGQELVPLLIGACELTGSTGERAAEAISRTEASKRPFAAGPGGWLEAVSTKL